MWAHDVDTPDVRRAAGRDRGRARRPHQSWTSTDWTRRDRRERPRWPATDVILGIETSCDETAAAVVVGGRDVLSSVVSQPGRPARPLRRRGARDRQPGPRRAAHAGGRASPGRGRRSSDDRVDAVGGHGRARAWSARCSSASSAAKALALVWDVPFVGGEPPRGAPVRRVPRGARPRAAARRAARVGRPHAARRDGGPRPLPRCSARPSTTPPARPSTRWPATSVSAIRAVRPSTDRRWRATPTAIRFPRAMLDDGLRLLLQRPQDGGRQPRPQAPRRGHAPTWPPRSRRPWSTCS